MPLARTRPLTLVAGPLLAAGLLAVAACGSSSSAGSPTASAAATPDAAASYGAPASLPPTAAPSTAPAGSGALPGVPAVTANATDVTKEPKVAAGTGAAPTGLVTRDLVVGTGAAAVASDTVKVRYEGALYTDGSVFDASWKNGSDPVTFPLSGVVPGFAQGIVGMKPGGRRELVIPPALGYGNDAQGGIPAGSTLVFVVDLVSVVTTPSPGPASTAPLGSGALPGVPPVTQNATDLAKEPVLGKATGAAPTGLVTRDLVVGKGTPATAKDTVKVQYVGVNYRTGQVFDASWTRGQAATFPLSGVVPGFAQGIAGMAPGGRREIVIPAALGYGPSGGNAQAGIQPDDTIVFVVDLIEVQK